MSLEIKYSAGLVVIYDKKVLLLHTTGRGVKNSYGIPKGGVEDGESNLEAAIRETREECGVDVPIEMVNTEEQTYSFLSRRHKYKKIVSYFIVEVDDLSQIGLDSEKIPKEQLQLEEVNRGGFYDYEECLELTMKSQLNIIYNIHSQNLI